MYQQQGTDSQEGANQADPNAGGIPPEGDAGDVVDGEFKSI
jgi:hypothetical protein